MIETLYQLNVAVLLADLHAQERNADASQRARCGERACRSGSGWRARWSGRPRDRARGRRPRRHDGQRGQAPSVPAVPQVLLEQSSAGAAHQGPHGREALQMQLLRSQVQAAQSRAAAHEVTHRLVHNSFPHYYLHLYIAFRETL